MKDFGFCRKLTLPRLGGRPGKVCHAALVIFSKALVGAASMKNAPGFVQSHRLKALQKEIGRDGIVMTAVRLDIFS